MVGGDPYSVVVSSVTLFLAESAFLWLFLLGLAVGVRQLARALGWRSRVNLARLTDRKLAQFFAFEVVFLAAWSVMFKIVLYGSVKGSSAALNNGDGAAFWYANGAEAVLLFLVLVGCFAWLKSAR